MADHWRKTFGAGERQAQERWGTPGVWDQERMTRLMWKTIPREYFERIEAAPFFFLATSNRLGECDCSFKGGGPGLVRILGDDSLAFPDFDGNQAFMSLGNLLDNPQLGLLFIDFSDGARLRVNGRATIYDHGDNLALFPNSKRVVLVDITQVVPNCSAHIPKLLPAANREQE